MGISVVPLKIAYGYSILVLAIFLDPHPIPHIANKQGDVFCFSIALLGSGRNKLHGKESCMKA